MHHDSSWRRLMESTRKCVMATQIPQMLQRTAALRQLMESPTFEREEHDNRQLIKELVTAAASLNFACRDPELFNEMTRCAVEEYNTLFEELSSRPGGNFSPRWAIPEDDANAMKLGQVHIALSARWSIVQSTNSRNIQAIDWLIDEPLLDGVSDWLIDWRASARWSDWLIDWLIDEPLLDGVSDWLIDWLIDELLLDGSIDWLTDWMHFGLYFFGVLLPGGFSSPYLPSRFWIAQRNFSRNTQILRWMLEEYRKNRGNKVAYRREQCHEQWRVQAESATCHCRNEARPPQRPLRADGPAVGRSQSPMATDRGDCLFLARPKQLNFK